MLRRALQAFLLLFVMIPASWAGSITLALSDNGGPYAEFAGALSDALTDSNWRITTVGKADTLEGGGRTDLIVTVGSDAFRQMLRRAGNAPIMATLLPRQSYERILAEVGRPRGRVGAIYLDQPPARQAAFIRQILPGQRRIGMLVSSETRGQFAQYRQAFANAGLTLDSEDSDLDSTLLAATNLLLPRVNVLLAIPDSTIYKRDNIKAILVSSYRHQRPVIAFSSAFVNAGALAALYSSPAQIARQLADQLTGPGPLIPADPVAPTMFSVAINQNVAQALGLRVPDEITIRRALLAERESR